MLYQRLFQRKASRRGIFLAGPCDGPELHLTELGSGPLSVCVPRSPKPFHSTILADRQRCLWRLCPNRSIPARSRLVGDFTRSVLGNALLFRNEAVPE